MCEKTQKHGNMVKEGFVWMGTSVALMHLGRYLDDLPSDGSDGKESFCNADDSDLIPGSGRFPWRREWLPTPGFLPGESPGQRSLEGYSPWGRKESDRTERLTL